MAKEIKKLQTSIWGGSKLKFEAHIKDTNMTEGGLLKLIISEYYAKVNTTYKDLK